MENIDKVIIEGLAEGRDKAYEYLYETHYKALCVYATQYVGDTFTAETIVGDVIFNIWKNRAELITLHSLRNYLLSAVRNRCLNYLEQQKRQENLLSHIVEDMENKLRDYEEQAEYPLSLLLEKELDLKIMSILASFPKLTRKIFFMSRFSNLKYQEIANELGVSIDVVKYHIKSALSQLRTELKEYFIIIFLLFSLF